MNNITYLSNPDNPKFINSPDSLAYQYIIEGKEVFPSFYKSYGDGNTLQQMDFGQEFARNCAKYTVEKLKKLDNPQNHLQTVITKFSHAIVELQDTEFRQALHTLRENIFQDLPQFCLASTNEIMMKAVVSQEIALVILQDVYDSHVKKQILAQELAIYNRHTLRA
jgi:hypothetical protein